MYIDPIALKLVLLQKNWTQKKLSKESLLSYSTVKNCCRGLRCSNETAEVIADVLGVELETLTSGKNYKKDGI